MKPLLILLTLVVLILVFFSARLFGQQPGDTKAAAIPSLAYNPYQHYPVYRGSDLGVTYSPAKTTIKVWSPPAEGMKLFLYKSPTGPNRIETVTCHREPGGVWCAMLNGERKDLFYTFSAKIKGHWGEEHPDPYTKAVGVNGKRGQIIDLRETDPPGWDQDRAPELKNMTDAVIYELHVRDLSVSPESGIAHKGKFLGLTETGTLNPHGQPTGMDHIAGLSVTHIHLLPVFDFATVDESKPEIPQYNWGYDPLHYSVPEGSYATRADDGKVRIREFKQMVQELHRNGLRVVMDVVYNHTAHTGHSNFDQLVPGYYYRQWEKDGSYSNASGCGNETASDREMVRKLIIESVTYWVTEYHIDGFRFDLMAIHDIETMNQVSAALHAIKPDILIYGEGWTAGDSPLPEEHRALKKFANRLNRIAVFSDDIRDGIKGSVFDDHSTGFASGNAEMTEQVKFGIVASGSHPQIDFSKVKYSSAPYTNSPEGAINYVSCHDNHTLYDKLKVSRPDADERTIRKMHALANTIVLTSQGIPFLHAGVEMKRTKGGEHNSYNKPDSVNRIDWEWLHENKDLVDYYRQMIALRKAHPAFRMPDAGMVSEKLRFLATEDTHLIAYQISDHANGDPWKNILVVFNGSGKTKQVTIPKGTWRYALRDQQFYPDLPEVSLQAEVAPFSALILFQP